MATISFNATKVATARMQDNGKGTGSWNGRDQHIIAGHYGGRDYRSFVRFNVDWTRIPMATLQSATLEIYRNKFHGSGTLSSNLKVQGMGKDWAEVGGSEGVYNNTWPYNWVNRAAYSSGARRLGTTYTQAVGTPNGNQYVKDSIDVKNIVLKWAPPRIENAASTQGENYANYGLILINDLEGQDSRCLEWVSNDGPATYRPVLVLTYDVASAPNAPINLAPTGGQETPGVPTLRGWLSDANPRDTLQAVHLQVFFDAAGNNLKWGSGILPASGAAFAKKVGNPNWSGGRHYWWRGRTQDTTGLWGPWCSLQEFISGTPPPAPTALRPLNGSTAWSAPTFTGVSKDVDGDSLITARVVVYEPSGAVHWDSGNVAAGGSAFSIPYAGPGLVNGTTYSWAAIVQNVHGRASAWSGRVSFTVPDTSAACYNLWTGKATTLTPTLTATAPATQNAYQYIVYNKNGGVHYDSGTVAASGTAISFTYGGTALAEGNRYDWKVRSRSTGNVWSDYSGTAPFWTNYQPVAIQVSPANGAVVPIAMVRTNFGDTDVANGLGDQVNELLVDVYEDDGSTSKYTITRNDSGMSDISHDTMLLHEIESFEGDTLWRILDGGYGTLSVDTVDFDTGAGSLEVDNPGTIATPSALFTLYPAGDKNSRRYWWDFTGGDTDISALRISCKASSTSNIDTHRIRFYDGAGNYSGFDLTTTTGWSETVLTIDDTPDETSGTLDWSNVIYAEVVLESDSGFSGTINYDNFRFSNTAGATDIYADETVMWRARYTDDAGAANSQGNYSSLQTLTLSHLPVMKSLQVQASDLTTGDIHNPAPTLTWTFAGSGGKSQKAKSIVIYSDPGDQQEQEVYRTGLVTSDVQSITVPSGTLNHTWDYRFEVTVEDTDGLTTTDYVDYTCTWTPPADLTPIKSTADEFTGATHLEWPMSELAPSSFDRYEVKRYDVARGVWELLLSTEDQTVTEYWDYSAPFMVDFVYKVTQFENVAGSVPVESLGDDRPDVKLDIDDWMIVVPDRTDLITLLYLKKETHGDAVQSEVFTPWGRNLKTVQRHGVTGSSGTLTCVVPNDEREDFVYKMDELNGSTLTAYLKTPFGDVWHVMFDPPRMSYRAGGHADVTLKFVEVA